MLLKEGCSPAQLGAHNVQAKLMRMTGHSSEYVYEFYNPPRLVWGHELLASNPFVHDSQFLYPSTSLEPWTTCFYSCLSHTYQFSLILKVLQPLWIEGNLDMKDLREEFKSEDSTLGA